MVIFSTLIHDLQSYEEKFSFFLRVQGEHAKLFPHPIYGVKMTNWFSTVTANMRYKCECSRILESLLENTELGIFFDD